MLVNYVQGKYRFLEVFTQFFEPAMCSLSFLLLKSHHMQTIRQTKLGCFILSSTNIYLVMFRMRIK
jgi:hypothetical protein